MAYGTKLQCIENYASYQNTHYYWAPRRAPNNTAGAWRGDLCSCPYSTVLCSRRLSVSNRFFTICPQTIPEHYARKNRFCYTYSALQGTVSYTYHSRYAFTAWRHKCRKNKLLNYYGMYRLSTGIYLLIYNNPPIKLDDLSLGQTNHRKSPYERRSKL